MSTIVTVILEAPILEVLSLRHADLSYKGSNMPSLANADIYFPLFSLELLIAIAEVRSLHLAYRNVNCVSAFWFVIFCEIYVSMPLFISVPSLCPPFQVPSEVSCENLPRFQNIACLKLSICRHLNLSAMFDVLNHGPNQAEFSSYHGDFVC